MYCLDWKIGGPSVVEVDGPPWFLDGNAIGALDQLRVHGRPLACVVNSSIISLFGRYEFCSITYSLEDTSFPSYVMTLFGLLYG